MEGFAWGDWYADDQKDEDHQDKSDVEEQNDVAEHDYVQVDFRGLCQRLVWLYNSFEFIYE